MKVKAILVGDSFVGKTTLVSRHLKQPYNQLTISTTSPVFVNSSVVVDGKTINLEIWDTAGQEQYKSLMPVYYRGAKVALVCFTKETIDSLESWVNLVRDAEPNCKFILVLTKSDLISEDEYDALYEQVIEKQKKLNAFDFVKTSSLENIGVSEAFDDIGKAALLFENNYYESKPLDKLVINDKKSCC